MYFGVEGDIYVEFMMKQNIRRIIGFEAGQTLIGILTLPLSSCVTGQCVPTTETPFPHL